MKRILAFVLSLWIALGSSGATYFATQAGAGSRNGLNSANAWAISDVNTSSNWSSPSVVVGKISPGDTLKLQGNVTTRLDVQASGTAGNIITILFDAGAHMSNPYWDNSGAISGFQKDYITVDGGAAGIIGGYFGDPSKVNGYIECTANGTNLANQVNSAGVSTNGCQYFTVKNLAIINLYVRVAGPDNAAGAAAIRFNDGNGRGQTHLLATNCYIHDTSTGVDFDYGTGDTYEMSFTTVFNCNWGGRDGDRGAGATMHGLLVHDNYFHDFTTWDAATDIGLHHNGFYYWAESGGTAYEASFYNNVIGPGFTNQLGGYNACTSGIFFSGTMVGPILIYDQLFINTGTYGPSNGLITGGSSLTSTWRIYNNTDIGGNGTSLVLFGTSTNPNTVYFQNNLVTGADLVFTCLYNTQMFLTSNHNLGYSISSAPFKWASGGSGGGITLAAWQAATLQDMDFRTGNPVLGSSFRPGIASPAINVGIDASAYFTPGTGFSGLTIGALLPDSLAGRPGTAPLLLSVP